MEMHKRRKTVTEPELRYFVRQIASACSYLHSSQIVHRDLTPNNLFLNDNVDLDLSPRSLCKRMSDGDCSASVLPTSYSS